MSVLCQILVFVLEEVVKVLLLGPFISTKLIMLQFSVCTRHPLYLALYAHQVLDCHSASLFIT